MSACLRPCVPMAVLPIRGDISLAGLRHVLFMEGINANHVERIERVRLVRVGGIEV